MAFIEVFLAAAVVKAVMDYFEKRNSHNAMEVSRQKPPGTDETVLSQADSALAKKTDKYLKKKLKHCTGEYFASLTYKERVALIEEILNNLIELYQLKEVVTYDFKTINRGNVPSYYNDETNTIVIDLSQWLLDVNEVNKSDIEQEFYHISRDTVFSVVHELRHAMQYRAIDLDDDSYFGINEARRIEFAKSILNFNTDDPQNYYHQTIEIDANTFAYQAMKGVYFNA